VGVKEIFKDNEEKKLEIMCLNPDAIFYDKLTMHIIDIDILD
jgi:hypothetical protein